jgi:hypothetical protein
MPRKALIEGPESGSGRMSCGQVHSHAKQSLPARTCYDTNFLDSSMWSLDCYNAPQEAGKMEQPDVAAQQLDRVLAFFPRADAKGSVLLAVDTGMLAVLASNCPPLSSFDWWMLIALLPLLLLGISLWHLYLGAFPTLKGGEESLIYFREIAKKREQSFIDAFGAQTEVAYVKDVLCQVWRNSQILTMKFDHISSAFNWMASAILPWLGSLVWLTIHYPSKGLHV